jgi:hypothetical protein
MDNLQGGPKVIRQREVTTGVSAVYQNVNNHCAFMSAQKLGVKHTSVHF